MKNYLQKVVFTASLLRRAKTRLRPTWTTCNLDAPEVRTLEAPIRYSQFARTLLKAVTLNSI